MLEAHDIIGYPITILKASEKPHKPSLAYSGASSKFMFVCGVCVSHLSQHHGGEHGSEVPTVSVAELCHDASVQQHQLQRGRGRPHAHQYSVPPVCQGDPALGVVVTPATATLDQNVTG